MHANHTTTSAGKKAAICQCCGAHARATEPTEDGEPDLWKMARGWSTAPFPADHQHDDGSTGSRYTCPACNKLLRAGHTVQTRGGQRTRLAA
jgi:hypothetical protein